MFHGSFKQNLKVLDTKKPITSHSKEFKNMKVVYVTDDKSYAAGLSFPWSDSEDFKFGKHEDDDYWTLEIPRKHLSKLLQPCSIYIVDGDFEKLDIDTPEWVSFKSVKVIDEEKYQTAKDCLQQNKVKIVLKD